MDMLGVKVLLALIPALTLVQILVLAPVLVLMMVQVLGQKPRLDSGRLGATMAGLSEKERGVGWGQRGQADSAGFDAYELVLLTYFLSIYLVLIYYFLLSSYLLPDPLPSLSLS